MTVLVTGARGTIARHVIAQLLDTGRAVRAASRVPGATDLPKGVEPVRVDFTAPETLTPALEGVEKVFLYAAHEGIDAFVAAAQDAGVKHVVLLSSAASANPDNEIGRMHLAVERPLEASGIPWTFVRPAMFATNSLWWAESIRGEGVVRLPYPDAPVNPIHERDIAEVAFAALTEDGHEGRTHVIDGPGHLTQRRQVELIGEAIGREIAVEELPRAVAAEFLPESLLDMLASGSTETWGPTAEAVTGRPARTFADWTADHADDFR
ncbi:NAD(P)H-binding protein [Glycomyces luteolus]|uniref:NAD(P)H-binding protein n=1 Tax=Glycomyces luteolus TaxID=2670330 RepID=A0A9X3P8N1_9ACTN|nr:NAD(P)H-binding protein [Glycomyces luteolus]MDA1359027.1 NAD(P)H-binding protein [Glycomyces luteolus]